MGQTELSPALLEHFAARWGGLTILQFRALEIEDQAEVMRAYLTSNQIRAVEAKDQENRARSRAHQRPRPSMGTT